MLISVVISYILKSIFSLLHQYILIEHIFVFSERAIILIVAAFIIAVIVSILLELKKIDELLLNISHKSVHDNIWKNIIDLKRGTTLELTSHSQKYIGKIALYEEKGNDSWFVLKDYIVVDEDGKIISDSDEFTKQEIESKLAINIKNIDMVELFYGKPILTPFEKIKTVLKK